MSIIVDFSIPIRVYVEDTDYGGIVYHANYLRFMERSRTRFLLDRGFSLKKMEEMGFYIVIFKASIAYHKPAFLDDELIVTTKTKHLGAASIDFVHCVYNQNNPDIIHCDGEFRVVCIDKKRRRPTPIPTDLREVLT